MTTPEPKQKKQKMDDDAAATDDSLNAPFFVKVGKTVYETSKAELLGREDESWFHAQLSGRWKSPDAKVDGVDLVLSSRDGKIFYYVLYYLRFGAIPYKKDKEDSYESLLDRVTLTKLQQEAAFFLLPGLTDLCKDAADIFKKFGSIGDFDGLPYTDFKFKLDQNHTRYDSETSYEVEYKYNGAVVSVYFSADNQGRNIRAYCSENKIVSNDIFEDKFRQCQAAIIAGNRSVSMVLAQVEMVPEAQLWFAFVVDRMLDYYEYYKAFDFEFGDDPLEFLVSDTTWGAYE